MSKRLYRSKQDRILAGVCGGIGEYFDFDPTIIRVLWALLIFAGGFGIIAYLVFWIVVPENPQQKYKTKKDFKDITKQAHKIEKKVRNKDQQLFGIILITIGAVFLFQTLFGWFVWEYLWPLVIIIVGLILLQRATSD